MICNLEGICTAEVFQVQKYLLSTTGQPLALGYQRAALRERREGRVFFSHQPILTKKQEMAQIAPAENWKLAVNWNLQRALTIPAVPHPEIQEVSEGATCSKSTLGIQYNHSNMGLPAVPELYVTY